MERQSLAAIYFTSRLSHDIVFTLIIDEQNSLVAFSHFEFIEDGGYIDYIYVLKEHQGRGIGKYLLINAMTKILSKYPNGKIMLSAQRFNKTAMRLYYSVGFRAFYHEIKFQLYRSMIETHKNKCKYC